VTRIERSQTTTASGKVTVKVKVAILEADLEAGGEVEKADAQGRSRSVRVRGCLLLHEAARLSNDSNRMWRQLMLDLKTLAPMQQPLQQGERLLELREVIKNLTARCRKLIRVISSGFEEVDDTTASDPLGVVKELKVGKDEQRELTEQLRRSMVLRTIR
jgi:hypothetical protein